MIGPWVAALLVAATFAVLSYGRHALRRMPLLVLRTVALATLLAMLFSAPFGGVGPSAPLVLLDRSASWQRADDGAKWREAVDSARQLTSAFSGATRGGVLNEAVLTVGDSAEWVARDALERITPSATTTQLAQAVEAAAVRGQAVVLITDGELAEASSDALLPPGSRTIRITTPPRRDAAIAHLEAPAVASSGDTIRVRVTVAVGAEPLSPSEVRLFRDDRAATPIVRRTLPALDAWSTYVADVLVPLDAGAQSRGTPRDPLTRTITAVLAATGDIEPRNDTLSVRVTQTPQPRLVFLSTAPDVDVRAALRVLRGISGVQLQAYLRVAPNQWRVEGPLSRIDEATVVQRAQSAGVAIVHGDSAWALTQRIVPAVLWTPAPPPPPQRAGEIMRRTEWYLREAPPSAHSAVLSAFLWDSLTPLLLDPARAPNAADSAAASSFTGTRLSASIAPWLVARAGKTGAATTVVWTDGPRVRINGSGFAAWTTRGAAGRDAVDALWGAIFDQVTREPLQRAPQQRVALAPSPAQERATRGANSDSMFSSCVTQSVPVQCEQTLTSVRAALSREWVPSAPVDLPVAPGMAEATGATKRFSSHGWPFVLVLVALTAEWLLRRRAGFR